MKKWKIIARHKNWYPRTTVTESALVNDTGKVSTRRFTATIQGWRNWIVYEGIMYRGEELIRDIQKRCAEISKRIESGDETVFSEK
jgi:hypothetical protein